MSTEHIDPKPRAPKPPSQQQPRIELELVLEQHTQAPVSRPVAHGDVLVVGRAPQCSVSLDDPSISRQHARIDVGVDGVMVTDTSTNGTLADGTVLRREAARIGFDRPIALGSSVLRVRRRSEPSSRSTAAYAPAQRPVTAASALTGTAASQELRARLASRVGAVANSRAALLALTSAHTADAAYRSASTSNAPAQDTTDGGARPELHALRVSESSDAADGGEFADLQVPSVSAPAGAAVGGEHVDLHSLRVSESSGAANGGELGVLQVLSVSGPAGAAQGGGLVDVHAQHVSEPAGAAQGGGLVDVHSQHVSEPAGAAVGGELVELHALQAGAAMGRELVGFQGPPPSAQVDAADSGAPIELRREVHRMLLEHLDMNAIDPTRSDDPALRPRVLAALRRIARMLDTRLPEGLSRDALVGEVADEALGLGPLERLLADPSVTEIMVVDAHHIFVERAGRLTLSGARFTDEERVRAAIERIVTPLGRRIDESSPLVDARLPDGSRVNVVIRPLALRGSCITIRKFARTPITMKKLLELGTLNAAMARFLTRSVRAKMNVLISGGTGSGKTTLLNVLSAAIPEQERIVTIEDAAELQLVQPHVVSLESRPANMEGKGEVAIRELVKNALRMRPDRIVVGECRGGEALDMLQAMNTGHDGSLTTTHANSPEEALMRIETLTLMAGVALPPRAIREQIAKSLHLIVQQTRLVDGSRKVTAISETAGIERDGTLRLRPLFEYDISGIAPDGRVQGGFEPTGYLPSFLPDLVRMGLMKKGEPLL